MDHDQQPARLGVDELRLDLADRANRLLPALRGMTAELAQARRDNARLRRENAVLRSRLRDQRVRSFLAPVEH